MKKEGKILALMFLSVLLISMFASVVSAATPLEQLTAFINSLRGGTAGTGFAQILLFILMLLLVYSVINFVPIIKNQNYWIKFGISAIVGWLSIMYLVPAEIYSILLSYQTLGIVLTTFLPFVIMLTFTIEWNQETPEYTWISSILWIAFVVVLSLKYGIGVYRWFTTGQEGIGAFGAAAYLITFVASLIFAWKGNIISLWIFKKRMSGEIQKIKQMAEVEKTAEIRRLKGLQIAMQGVDPDMAKYLKQQIENLQASE